MNQIISLFEKTRSDDLIMHQLFAFYVQFPNQQYLLVQRYNRNTKRGCEICSKFTIKAQERCRRSHSGVFIADFELVSHIVLVFLLLTLNNQIRARSRDCIQISLEFFVSLKELICIESIMFTDIFRWYRQELVLANLNRNLQVNSCGP